MDMIGFFPSSWGTGITSDHSARLLYGMKVSPSSGSSAIFNSSPFYHDRDIPRWRMLQLPGYCIRTFSRYSNCLRHSRGLANMSDVTAGKRAAAVAAVNEWIKVNNAALDFVLYCYSFTHLWRCHGHWSNNSTHPMSLSQSKHGLFFT